MSPRAPAHAFAAAHGLVGELAQLRAELDAVAVALCVTAPLGQVQTLHVATRPPLSATGVVAAPVLREALARSAALTRQESLAPCPITGAPTRVVIARATRSAQGKAAVLVTLDDSSGDDGRLAGALEVFVTRHGPALEAWSSLVWRSARADLFEEALAHADMGLWAWEPRHGTLDWSRGLLELFAVEPATFPGTLAAYLEALPDEERPKVSEVVSRAMTRATTEGSADYVVQHRVHVRHGEPRYVEGRGHVVAEGGQVKRVVGIATDATQVRRAQAQLEESEERYRIFSALASDYVYAVSLAEPGQLVPSIVAGSFERTTGLTLADVQARGGWLSVVHPQDRAHVEAGMAELLAGRSLVNEYRIEAQGEVRWLRDTVRPTTDASGKVVGLTGGVRDITHEKRLEEQLAHARKLEALARLAGGVAHDFNNLLSVLFASLDLLRLEAHRVPPVVREAAEEISNAAQRGADLTRSLLAFARRTVGSPGLFDVAEQLSSTRTMLERAVGPSVFVRVDAPEPALVRMDAGQLQLVVLNLALNARDAMPDGGTLALDLRHVSFGPHDAARPPDLSPGAYVALTVRDNGVGMDANVLAHLFEPFFTTKGAGKGTGLGLATSYGTVRQAGGTITVTSAPGVGTSFTVLLPRAERRGADGGAAKPEALVGGDEVLLLVEDEPILRRLASRTLGQRGYVVLEADSTEQALELLAQRGEQVRLLVSDIVLPGKDGLELARWVRGKLPHARVLLMSGFVADERHLSEVQASEYPLLAKPFTPEGLARRVREVLDAPR